MASENGNAQPFDSTTETHSASNASRNLYDTSLLPSEPSKMLNLAKIQVKIPTDPYKAKLLMMAEEKNQEHTNSGLATDDSVVEVERAFTDNTLTVPLEGHPDGHLQDKSVNDLQPMHHSMMNSSPLRSRKRGLLSLRLGKQLKRGRMMPYRQVQMPLMHPVQALPSLKLQKEPGENICLKKIQVKIPTDPYKAKLLMIAEEKNQEHTNSGLATDDSVVEVERAFTDNTLTVPQGGHPDGHLQDKSVNDLQSMHHFMMTSSPLRRRKRGLLSLRPGKQLKRGRMMPYHQVQMPLMQPVQALPSLKLQKEPGENICLKYTLGLKAWKHWVAVKNVTLQKSSRHAQLYKTEILQLTLDELNYSLCLFLKEFRKPNGQEYAPDTLYYFCMGIQRYLFENGRTDNLFYDSIYKKFRDCLDEVAKKFSVLSNVTRSIVTRVEEEHFWETQQLGVDSPQVLLNTLMFFNTVHFKLATIDEHMQLSFSHVVRCSKRPGASQTPGVWNVYLRFYSRQSVLKNSRPKKMYYEQHENEENPLRCPVKLYLFYLSRCPESMKTNDHVFYLQPCPCGPESSLYYSTTPVPREALEKMLRRIRMVEEVNASLHTS